MMRCVRQFKEACCYFCSKSNIYVAIIVSDDSTIFNDLPLACDVHALFAAHSCMNKNIILNI